MKVTLALPFSLAATAFASPARVKNIDANPSIESRGEPKCVTQREAEALMGKYDILLNNIRQPPRGFDAYKSSKDLLVDDFSSKSNSIRAINGASLSDEPYVSGRKNFVRGMLSLETKYGYSTEEGSVLVANCDKIVRAFVATAGRRYRPVRGIATFDTKRTRTGALLLESTDTEIDGVSVLLNAGRDVEVLENNGFLEDDSESPKGYENKEH